MAAGWKDGANRMGWMHPDEFFGRYRVAPPRGEAPAVADTRAWTAARTTVPTPYHVRKANGGCRVITVLPWVQPTARRDRP